MTVAELYDDYERAFEVSGKRAIEWVKRCWDKHLEPFFGKYRARQITTDLLNRYIQARRAEGAAVATCNRELACLRAAFNLARKSEKISHVPHFPTLIEDNVRTGFVEHAEYQKLIAQNPPLYMRLLLALGYTFGFRKSELLDMRAGQVDLLARTIRLNPGSTKNREGRLVSFEGLREIEALLQQAMSGKTPNDPLFTRDDHKRVLNFREAWYNLTVSAGLGKLVCPKCDQAVAPDRRCSSCGKVWKINRLRYQGLLFHDLRRSAVRNLMRSGISEHVAMQISGHRTTQVFRRYDIVAERDLQDAARKIAASQAEYVRNGHRTDIEKDNLTERQKRIA
ncbi:MAG: tyrosine-type recombinase/integrase [Terriglobia bacterium]